MIFFLTYFVFVPIVATLFMVLMLPISFYYAWVLSYLWLWFFTPLGVPAVTVLQAWGICVTISFLQTKLYREKRSWGKETLATAFVTGILAPIFALGMGYIIRFWWMP